MSLQNNFFKNIIEDIIKNVFNLSDSLKSRYQRCTFVKMGECRICNHYDPNQAIFQISPRNFEGIVAKYGWIACQSCTSYAEIKNLSMEIQANFIYLDRCGNYYEKNPYSFWRVSLSKNKKPFLQKNNFLTIENGDIYFIENKSERIYVSVTWVDNNDSSKYWYKSIPLVNFIFFNRQSHGYRVDDFPPLQKKNEVNSHPFWRKNWIPKIEYEYNFANKIHTWILSINRLGNEGIIPYDIAKELISDPKGRYWRCFF